MGVVGLGRTVRLARLVVAAAGSVVVTSAGGGAGGCCTLLGGGKCQLLTRAALFPGVKPFPHGRVGQGGRRLGGQFVALGRQHGQRATPAPSAHQAAHPASWYAPARPASSPHSCSSPNSCTAILKQEKQLIRIVELNGGCCGLGIVICPVG